MRVLILGYVWPEPSSSAAGKRTMDLISLFLERGWQVDFATAAADSEHRVNLAALGVPEHRVALNCESFDAFVAELAPDLVIFDRFFTEEQFGWRVERACPAALRVIDTIDLHSLRETRHSLPSAPHGSATGDSYFSQLRKAMLSHEKTVREIAAIFRSDLSLMISEFETQFLIREFQMPSKLLHTCGFMVDEAAASPGPLFQDRQGFVSIGNFRHAPNWDSVQWLSQEIWPLIRAQMPDAQIRIYGSYAPQKAMELHKPKNGFHVLGRAQDALEVIRSARVLLAPLRFGAGQKGKLLDALIAGTPSVTTPVGAEGMTPDLSYWNGLVSNSAQDIASAAVRLYEDQKLWESSQAKGFELLRNQFSKSVLGPALVKRIEEAHANKSQTREDNFMGAMLRHHLFQSTKHLSNWIQLKSQSREGSNPR